MEVEFSPKLIWDGGLQCGPKSMGLEKQARLGTGVHCQEKKKKDLGRIRLQWAEEVGVGGGGAPA